MLGVSTPCDTSNVLYANVSYLMLSTAAAMTLSRTWLAVLPAGADRAAATRQRASSERNSI